MEAWSCEKYHDVTMEVDVSGMELATTRNTIYILCKV
jgi:hypothetical protein